MSDEMDAARQGFQVEAEELLEDMEEALLHLENEPGDMDAVSAIFRAAHTIKGTAGVFGFDDVVSFTHVAESLLDLIRDEEIKINDDIIAVLLKSGDHMADLVNYVVETEAAVTEELLTTSNELISQLEACMGKSSGAAGSEVEEQTSNVEAVSREETVKTNNDYWHISLRFGLEVLKGGMDPQSFIRYLQRIGEIVSITTLVDNVPALNQIDPENCYLGFEIGFDSDENKESIESVFDFVKEDCQVRILPPDSLISEYLELIRELPEEDWMLGEILLKSKVLTRKELQSMLTVQQSITKSGNEQPLGKILVDAGVVDQQVVSAAVEKQQVVRGKKKGESKSVRVDAVKLDALINLVGELVIANSSSFLLAEKSENSELMEANSITARLVEEIRDSALRLRMVQIGDTFNRFQRVVRDVSRELGKDIELSISGAETELDKTVVEKIGDPLMHLVRNSMDHGIESSEERESNAKPATGKLSLSAYHDSGSIVIEVTDDGRGLDKEKLLNKAIEKGLLKEGVSLTDAEIYRLIFEAGLSTAKEVTNISGRGVGMDVVKRNIESLRGSIDVESEVGIGSTIRIRLPLTLAIIDGFLVGVENASYVIPLDTVIECVELSEEDRLASLDRSYINLRGEVLPFIRLREMFQHGNGTVSRENIVVVQYAGKRAGIVVDELLGELQTVIKPLGKIFSQLSGISGSTILGSGEVAVILDVPALVGRAAESESSTIVKGATSSILQISSH
ncbi:MAG: chemotaxis protein CheA [Gammaproteobacteria bacterium]|nr:chemotaxis protein CheA [Gammaproteobacteria bacterium]